MLSWAELPDPNGRYSSRVQRSRDWKPAQPNDQNLGGNWWTIFKDPELDKLELQSMFRTRI